MDTYLPRKYSTAGNTMAGQVSFTKRLMEIASFSLMKAMATGVSALEVNQPLMLTVLQFQSVK